MANLKRPIPHTLTVGQKEVTIWGDTTEVKKFFPSAAPDVFGAGVSKTVTRKATTVRRYPGDPSPFTRKGASYSIYPEKPLSNKTTPGRRFWCEVSTTGVLGNEIDVTQFTFTGPFYALKQAARTGAPRDFVIRSPGGAAYEVVQLAGP